MNARPPVGHRVFRWVLVVVFAVALLLSTYWLLTDYVQSFTTP
ncbi:hypothetical protein [Saccharopolyspora oryzae]|uniref:Uncharacterized protein n=1 Tax=Saccharopolyspora oryzae TaxID=2997343 RepID=A0ABT4V332_9PSEU|nr:hypothetical protein [Saccharopolyspora oryzae]MDA3627826.1 hypothetical protein [Saccharopolyspora oryzae]